MFSILALTFALIGVQTQSGTVTGRVFHADTRQPASGIVVELLRKTYDEFGMPQVSSVATSLTDEKGEYRIENILPFKDFYLGTRYQRYQATYFPRASDFSSALPVQVRPGEVIGGFDFELVPARLVSVRGRVLDALKVRQPHLSWVTLVGRYPTPIVKWPSSRVAEDGSFDIPDVPRGSYYIVGSRIDDEPHRAQSVLPIEVGEEDIGGLELVSAEGHDIEGRVRVEGGSITPFNVMVRPVGEAIKLLEQQPAVNPKDGNFVISNLPSGEYQLSVKGLPEEFYLKSARFGATDVLLNAISLRGATSEVLEVVVSNDGARVDGTIVGPGSQLQRMAVLVPEVFRPGRFDLYKTVAVSPDGHFTIRGLAPGNYQIFAIEENYDGSFRDPEVISRFKDRAILIKVSARELVTVELRN